MLRRLPLILLCLLAFSGKAGGAESPLARFNSVAIAPTKTSIYIGSVALTMPAFVRTGGVYESTYAAKVFPYFFSSETGRLAITLPDESLLKLERGEPVEFTGRAINSDREDHRIEGKATPVDAAHGKIKVRVFVSPRIELIFNTTYRFLEK